MDLPVSTTAGDARRVHCVYPVSGTYTSPQRNLFHLTTALALLGHEHEWLTAGALAFTVSYSSTAAVHGLALAFQGDLHRDGDTLAAGAVVQWAMYASLACALFCPRLLGRNLALLVNAWAFLLVASHLALVLNSPRLVRNMAGSLVLSWRGEDGLWSDPCAGMGVRTAFRGYPGDSMSPVVWDDDVGSADGSSLPRLSGADGDIVPMPDVVRAADVVSFMALQSLKNSLLLAPSIHTLSVDRRASRNDGFIRLLAKRVLYPPSRRKGPKMFPAIVILRSLQLHWFLLQCFPILTVVEFPIRIAARVLFQHFEIRGLRLQDISFLEPQLSQRRYQAAKYAAMSLYVLTLLGYVTWIPAAAPFATGGASGLLADIPESETFRAVGQWSSWLTLALAITTALANRLLGADQIDTMDSWVQQHRFRFLYARVRNRLAAEWAETREWWRNPERQAIASLRAAEQDDDTGGRFTSRMIQALEAFRTDQTAFILPPPMPRQPDEQLRGEDGLPVYGINVVESTVLRSTARKGKGKEKAGM
ncbi:hypothetical protein SLS64_005182 [Diaporthe eres]|uniref:Uncharacterized protein n=1 Tax=Diaporthe eres TaxID=83184 RepID=A0ABR1P2Z8_DIAER